jgi:hypothetical protein
MRRHAERDSQSALRGRLAKPGRFGLLRSRAAIAAVEFALIAPVMIAPCAGLYDLTAAFLASQRVNMAALAIAQMATYQAANGGSTNTNFLNLSETQTVTSAIYAYLPATLAAVPLPFGVVVTSVIVTPPNPSCTNACTYIPKVAWSGRYQGGAGSLRACGDSILTWADNSANPSATTLPTNLQQPQPILVVDVYYTFQPLFFTFITGDILMMQTAYFPPRAGLPSDWVQSSDQTAQCPGYPWST